VTGLPEATPELVRRLEHAGVRFSLEWLRGLSGVRVEQFGRAYAAVNPALPELDFMNTVMGLYPEDERQVAAIAELYAEVDVRAWFELAPAEHPAVLHERLVSIGARAIGFYTMVYGRPEAHEADPRVRPVRSDEAERFGKVLLRGHGAPEGTDVAHIVRWAQLPAARAYVAEIDGRAVAAGALSLEGGIGYLASASTLPEFRGRGLQTALIRARIDAAASAGCELASSQAAFGSGSQRNLERAGLRIGYTKTIWRVGGP
jgi:GNAT superfamily N-acetyltransferase